MRVGFKFDTTVQQFPIGTNPGKWYVGLTAADGSDGRHVLLEPDQKYAVFEDVLPGTWIPSVQRLDDQGNALSAELSGDPIVIDVPVQTVSIEVPLSLVRADPIDVEVPGSAPVAA